MAIRANEADAANAYYYKGLAQWSLASLPENSNSSAAQLDQAVAAFKAGVAQDDKHVGAILGLCQISFERQDRAIDEQRRDELSAEITRALTLATNPTDRAKAYYVQGLGLVRDFVDTKQEQTFVDALNSFLASGQASATYLPLVQGYFAQAVQRTWADAELASQASELSNTFDALDPPEL